MTTHVISWSGGPDSTYSLLRFLRETSDPVVTVSVGAAVDPKFVRACMRATQRLEGPIRERTRDFRVVRYSLYTENTVAEPIDEITALTVATVLQVEDPIVYWCRCAEDDQPGAWQTRNANLLARSAQMIERVAPLHVLNTDVAKSTIRKELGDLWDLTWSCLFPTEDLEPCRRCDKCRERKRAGRM